MLLENLSVYDNVRLPLEIAQKDYERKEIEDLIKQLGIGEIIDKKCRKLSDGEKQRVAIARALINKPKLLLADEPIGNIDYECRNEIMDIKKMQSTRIDHYDDYT